LGFLYRAWRSYARHGLVYSDPITTAEVFIQKGGDAYFDPFAKTADDKCWRQTKGGGGADNKKFSNPCTQMELILPSNKATNIPWDPLAIVFLTTTSRNQGDKPSWYELRVIQTTMKPWDQYNNIRT